ncbi:capZ-interacting protein isoform 2-T2 [Thomomys bottae]
MEERTTETKSSVDSSTPPSVAQLAGRFREQAAAAKEKSSPNTSHPPKMKVKSSPLIEKLQANLTFDPAALLPGASPKSPGLKAMVSPFHSPPSTPSSPGMKSQCGEAEEVPVSFDQPPEGTHLPCYNKVRTRGSIKRRPPSRRFRRSQSDCGELGDFRSAEPSQENGAREENGDDVFTAKSKAPGSPSASEESMGEGASGSLGPEGKPPLKRTSSRLEKQEKAGVLEETKQKEETGQNPEDTSKCPAQKESLEPPHTSSPQAENGYGNPMAEKTAGEELEAEKSTEEQVKKVGNDEDRPREQIQDANKLEETAEGGKTLQNPPGGKGDSDVSEQEEQGKGNRDEQEGLDTGCSTSISGNVPLEPSKELQSTQAVHVDDTSGEDTKM